MIQFKDKAGTTLFGQWYEPDDSTKFPVVLFATGDGASGSKGLTWTNVVPKFLELGIGCFSFDFDGLGHSPNDRRELTLTKGITNIEAAIREISNNPRADRSRIGAFGASFGGNILLLVGSRFKELKVMALKSPCCFIAEAFVCEYGLEKVEEWSRKRFTDGVDFFYDAFLDSYYYNTYEAAKSIDIPVLVVHGSKDSAVPLRQSLDLMKFLPKGELKIIEGADHWYSEGNEWEVMAKTSVEFIRKHI